MLRSARESFLGVDEAEGADKYHYRGAGFMETLWVSGAKGPIEVKALGSGPVILCVHGWPELWYSWRHQMHYFADRGYRVAAMNVRGYGGSAHPVAIEDYSLEALSDDIRAVAEALSDDAIVLFGHDWGAPQVYTAALRFPDRIRAVAGLSVPFMTPSEASSLDLWEALYPDRFFYQSYFQTPGKVEAELSIDIRLALRKIYYALSGEAPLNEWLKPKPKDAGLLVDLQDPSPFPAWMTDEDLQVYIDAFETSGFIGPINRYRAQVFDAQALPEIKGARMQQPLVFVGGSRDPVRNFLPGVDLYEQAGAHSDHFCGATLLAGAGHWVQQEQPQETNEALAKFLDHIDRG